MTPEAWFAVAVVVMVIAVLATDRVNTDVAIMGGLTLLLIGDAVHGGILPLGDALRGFAHPAIFMIGSLFVVAAGLTETGAIAMVAQRLLGRPKTVVGAQLRMMFPVSVLSGFMNNTPIVAMYLPVINDWARQLGVSPSKLYMPLSFSAMLGGKISMIGTASNVLVIGLFVTFINARIDAEVAGTTDAWLSTLGVVPFSAREQFWNVGLLGVPTTIAGILLIAALSRWLLPERRAAAQGLLDSRRYQVEMLVQPDSPIVNQTIEEAGLRNLPGLYLTQIERGDKLLHAVGPDQKIEADDVLAFAGILESVVDVRKIRGLVPATDQIEKVQGTQQERRLVEAVVAHNSPLVSSTVRQSNFRTRFNAAIIAVHRNGEVVKSKIGDIMLRAGDTLLLDTHEGFVATHRNNDDFYLVSNVEGSRPIRHEHAGISLSVLVVLVLLLTLTTVPPVIAALSCAGLMVVTRCVGGTRARSYVNWQILIVIGGALGLGESLQHTGAAHQIAQLMLNTADGLSAQSVLLMVFAVTALFAQVITSYGAAVLMFPIAMASAETLSVNPEPFAITLMVAAGSTYLTPVAYQTNLMVYGPGGYKFLDYMRLGLPLTVLVGAISVVLAPFFFPFVP